MLHWLPRLAFSVQRAVKVICEVPSQPQRTRNTYLAVIDDNGGQYGPMKVDGKLPDSPHRRTGPDKSWTSFY